jgi:hypothetical protein
VQRANDFRQHRDHAQQEVSRGSSVLHADDLEPAADLEDCRALGRGATSDPVDASFLGLGVLAGAFGDVENDGNGGPAQLVSQFSRMTSWARATKSIATL